MLAVSGLLERRPVMAQQLPRNKATDLLFFMHIM